MPMRSSTLLMLVLGAACLTAAEPTPVALADQPGVVWEPSLTSQTAMAALIDQAIALGFPDTAGCTLHYGPLTITAPGQEPQIIKGLHAQRPDGSWLVLLAHVPAEGVTVDAARLRVVAPADVLALAYQEGAALMRTIPEAKQLKATIPGFTPELETMVRGSSDGFALAELNRQELQRISQDQKQDAFWWSVQADLMTQVVAFQRLGIPHAATMMAVVALFDLQIEPEIGNSNRLNLDPPGRLGLGRSRRSRPVGGASVQISSSEALLRRWLIGWFRQQVTARDSRFRHLSVEQAGAGCQALLDPADAVGRAEIQRLVAWSALPVVPGAKSDALAVRLTTWRIGDDGKALSEIDLRSYERMDAPERAQWSSLLRDQVAVYQAGDSFTPHDLDTLMALIPDRRPSRWCDQGHVRTVGDQALRAIASVFRCDPRIFIDRSPAAIWTEAERDAVAVALAAWWAERRHYSEMALLAEPVAYLRQSEIVHLLKYAQDSRARAASLDRLATMWHHPPRGDDMDGLQVSNSDGPVSEEEIRRMGNQSLIELLIVGYDHQAFAATVDGWPVSGDLRVPLATWHALRGRRQPLATALADALAAAVVSDRSRVRELNEILTLETFLPDSGVWTTVQKALAGSADQEPTISVMRVLSERMETGQGFMLMQRWQQDRNHGRRKSISAPLRLALAAQLLGDVRPAPPAVMALATTVWQERENSGQRGARNPQRDSPQGVAARPLAADLRLADYAAMLLVRNAWGFGLVSERERRDPAAWNPPFDPTASLTERDAWLAPIRAHVRTVLLDKLSEAGLSSWSVPGMESPDAPRF